MNNEKIFRTRLGFCHVTPDKIAFTRTGDISTVSDPNTGTNNPVVKATRGVIALLLFYFAYNWFKEGSKMFAIVLTVIGAYLIYGIIWGKGYTYNQVIERKDVRNITFTKGLTGYKSHFEIQYDDNGKMRNRWVDMPGVVGGIEESEKALQIFREEKLMN